MPVPDRIALLTNFILPYRLPVLRELSRRCRDLRIFTSTPMAEIDGVTVHAQKSWTWWTTWRHPHKFTEPLGIHIPYDTVSQLARFNPDVVISGEMGLRSLQAAAFTRFSRQRSLVLWATVSETTEQGRGRIRPHLRKALLHSADSVIVNGASGARYVERFGIAPEKIFRVPQTTEIGPFLKGFSARPRTIWRRLLFCGRLIELKGLVPFLSRLAAWAMRNPREHVEFSMAGDGQLRSAIAGFPCPENLRLVLLGNIPYDRLPGIYANTEILAFPTLADEWGLVVVEAMAAGLPVLGSVYSQAVEDLISDGINGWVFRPDREEEMDSALDRALRASAAELDAMGARAHQVAREMTPSVMADQIMDAVAYACAPSSTAASAVNV